MHELIVKYWPLKFNATPTLVQRILVRILPLVLLSLIAITISNYVVAREQISTYIREEIRTLSDPVAMHVRNFMEQRDHDIKTLAQTPLITDYCKNLEYSLAQEARMYADELKNYFLAFSRRTGVYDSVCYYNPHGELVAAVQRDRVLLGRSSATACARIATEPQRLLASLTPGAIGALPVTRIIAEAAADDHFAPSTPIDDWQKQELAPWRIYDHAGHRQLVLVQRIRDGENNRGTLVLVCNLDSIEELLASAQIGSRGAVYLVDAAGMPSLGVQSRERLDLRQESEIVGTPWGIVVEADSEEFLRPLVYLRNLTALLSLFVGLLVMLTLSGSIRRATRPIDHMAHGTGILAAGDLDYRFPLPRIRELQPLASAFNDMAAKLQVRNEELESRIRQLTALRSVENAVTEQMEEEAMLRTWLRAVTEGLDVDRACLYWVDPEDGHIVGRYVHGPESMRLTEERFRQLSVSLGDGDILNRVVERREPMLVKDPATTPGVYMSFINAVDSPEFVIAPVCGKHRVFGVICADNCTSGRPVEEHHMGSLMLFASTAGLALENAMLLSRLSESESRHRIVLENSPVAILGLSRDHKVTTWNRGAEQIFGFRASEVFGRPLHTLFPDDQREALDELIAQVIKRGAVREHAMVGQSCNGDRLDVTVSWGGSDRDFWSNDEWAVVIRDVTEAKRYQRQLIFSEKLSAVGQLIAGIAHELNNPLQAVVGYSELLIDGEIDSPRDCRKQLEHIYECALRCRKIIDNLLLFVRRGEVEQRATNMSEVVDAALDLLSSRIKKRKTPVTVTRHLPESPLFVYGNFQQIEQVVINLVNNACDALEEMRRPGAVDVTVRSESGRVLLEIADDGPGIPDKIREMIFEPFFTTKGEHTGTGLGLALCRQIVEEHKGTIVVEPRQGGGTLFRCSFPASSAPEVIVPRVRSDGQRSNGRSILIVEDEPVVRALLVDLLEADRHRVCAVAAADAARELIVQQPPDLIISDVYLGNDVGFDFYHKWNRFSDGPRPPIIFITGDILGSTVEQVPDDPMTRLLQKPVNLQQFREAIAELLAASAERQKTSR